MYRTPQGLRSFARLFSIFLPVLYTPYYAQIAFDLNNTLTIAILFCIITCIALTSLFETINQMEDPFDPIISILDGIHVNNELNIIMKKQLITLRTEYFPNAVIHNFS